MSQSRFPSYFDSGFNSSDTISQEKEKPVQQRSTSSSFPTSDGSEEYQYGIFLLEEDQHEQTDGNEIGNSYAHSHYEMRKEASTSITFPGAFMEGFRNGNIEFNIPGVMKDTFAPPDDVHVRFKLPSDDSGAMGPSDVECLTKAGEVMTEYWRRQEEPEYTSYDGHSVSATYRSYFEGAGPGASCFSWCVTKSSSFSSNDTPYLS